LGYIIKISGEVDMSKSEIIKRVQIEIRMGRIFCLASKQNSDPKVKLALDKRAAIHYLNAHRLLKKVNG
jgi:hypothetical protein